MCGFNPRSREGATFTADREDRAILVSIHAPAKERHYLQFLFYAKNEFQSTLPRRSDTISLRADRGLRSFNPRSREGATHSEQSNNKRIVFQSTLPRRSDDVRKFLFFLFNGFNPRSREGATPFTTNFLSPTYNILSHFAQIVLFKIFKSASINAPLTHFVTFFDASLQTFLCTLSTRTEHVLHNQHLISSCAAVYAYMLDFRLVFISQIIKSQAVHLSIYNIRQNGF